MKTNTNNTQTLLTSLGAAALLALPLAASAQGYGGPGYGGPNGGGGRVFRGADGDRGPGFGGPGFGRPGFDRAGRVTWAGSVDDTTIVTIRRGDVNTRVVSGKDAGDVSAQVVGRLPDRPAEVFLADRQGRGRIQVLEQPTPDNGFTARVRLHDPQPGRGFYRFTLAWRPAPGF